MRAAPRPGSALTPTERRADDPTPTQAVLPPPPPQLAWWQGAGELQLTTEQQSILWQPVDEAEVLIRPDGIVYLPWAIVWRTILKAFSPYVPSIIPLAKPAMQDGVMCCHVVMVVNGKYIGDAVGECRYQPMNRQMSWASAAEGAVSDAIVKISKRLGMFQELWSVPWGQQWRATHAMQVEVEGQRNKIWRRIDAPPLPGERLSRHQSAGEYDRPQDMDHELRERFEGLSREPGQEG